MCIRDSVYPVRVTDFDADPWQFNCRNGTLNLRTREFKPHSPHDFLSLCAGVNYDPSARCERWERFIEEIMQGDTDRAAFLQKALGYALTGDTEYECFFILYGPTSRNGKGTCMETFRRLMGEYGRTAKPDTIAMQRSANKGMPSEDVARLAGARFVNISEPDKKLVLKMCIRDRDAPLRLRCVSALLRRAAAKGAFEKAVILPELIGQTVAAAVQYPVYDHAAEVAEYEICNPFRRRLTVQQPCACLLYTSGTIYSLCTPAKTPVI